MKKITFYWIGITIGCCLLAVLNLPSTEKFHAKGIMNTGHENIECESCHELAPGSKRQQVQANVRYLLGLRTTPVFWGTKPVDAVPCLSCHERPNDRHPVSRFLEPRFARVRDTLNVHQCSSCHMEHSGKRVTVDVEYCRHCHETTNLKQDRLQPSHRTLIQNNQWSSCLGCHDFHGNHIMKPSVKISDTIEVAAIKAYFNGAAPPYKGGRLFRAKKERTHEP